jgi:hypothetical protein
VILLDQEYLREDLPMLLEDIGNMITEELATYQTSQIHIRIKPAEKKKIEENAIRNGYKSVSEFMKQIALAQ